MANLEKMSDAEIQGLKWYYKMELRDGVFTNGTLFENIRATRKLMGRVDVDGLRALDIGAQECANSVLLAKAGASVTAYDRRKGMEDRIKLVEQGFGVSINYKPGLPFHRFANRHIKTVGDPFDFVLFSGVLYHVISPGLFMWYVRSLMAPGGIMVMETSMAIDEDPVMYMNANGRYSKMTNYYQVSSGWLDYMIRYLGMRIVDVEYVSKGTISGKKIARCAMLCLLDGEPVCDPDDEWGPVRRIDREYSEFVRLPEYEGAIDHHGRAKPKPYSSEFYRKGLQSLDLTKVLNAQAEVERDTELSVLHQADRL